MTSLERILLIRCGLAGWGLAVSLALIALVLALVALRPGPSDSLPATATTTVQAIGEWQSCGLSVYRGQRVLIVAAGAWRHDGYEDTLYGPDGVGIHFDTAVLPDVKVGRLLARIGQGEPFAVGSSAAFTAESDIFGIRY
jgi:hypothetical protein